MNLKYQILWFEDDEDLFTTTFEPETREFLNEFGFELECMHRTEGSQFNELSNKSNFDLIITDLNLEEDEMGKMVLDSIRNEQIFTDVLLYSQNDDAISKIIDDADKLIERVSFSVGIENLMDKVKTLIKLTIKKVEDVTNLRGLVMAAAIDLEVMIEELIKDFFKIIGNDKVDSNKKEILKNICANKLKNDSAQLEKLKQMNHENIDTLLEENILTASTIYDALMSSLSYLDKYLGQELNNLKDRSKRKEIMDKKNKIVETRKKLNNFQTEIINVRNTLAHVKEEIDDDGIYYLKNIKSNGTAIKFDDKKYIEIRTNFKTHLQTIKDIRNLIMN